MTLITVAVLPTVIVCGTLLGSILRKLSRAAQSQVIFAIEMQLNQQLLQRLYILRLKKQSVWPRKRSAILELSDPSLWSRLNNSNSTTYIMCTICTLFMCIPSVSTVHHDQAQNHKLAVEFSDILLKKWRNQRFPMSFWGLALEHFKDFPTLPSTVHTQSLINWLFDVFVFGFIGVILAVLYGGAKLIVSNEISPGHLMSFLVTSQTIQRWRTKVVLSMLIGLVRFRSLAQVSVLFGQAIKGLTASSRVFEVQYNTRIIRSLFNSPQLCFYSVHSPNTWNSDFRWQKNPPSQPNWQRQVQQRSVLLSKPTRKGTVGPILWLDLTTHNVHTYIDR